MRFKLVFIVLYLLSSISIVFSATQTINTIPSADSNFLSNTQTFLRNENAQRAQRALTRVVSGGIGATSANLTHTISTVVAYVEGYYVTDASVSHTYTLNKDTFVLLRYNDATTIAIAGATITYDGNFVFAEMINGTAQPNAPSGTLMLFESVTDGTSITTVNDYRDGGIVFLSDPIFADGVNGRLNDAAATIGSSLTATLWIDCDDQVSSNTTVTSNIELLFTRGNILTINATKTLTINGPVTAGIYQIKSGAGTLSFGIGHVSKVYPEWWGAKAVATKAEAIAAGVDYKTEIDAAIATKKDVIFQSGYYATTGGHTMSQYGQKLLGDGRVFGGADAANPYSGTVIYRLSGTADILTLGAVYGMEVGYLTIDGDSASGNCIYDTSMYSYLHDIRIVNQGGTGDDGWGIYSLDANVNVYERILFVSCYSGWRFSRTTAAGTSSCRDISINETTSYNMYVGPNVYWMSFDNVYLTDGLYIDGPVGALSWNNVSIEFEDATSTMAMIDMVDEHVKDTIFNNVRIRTAANIAAPTIRITSAAAGETQNITFNDLAIVDEASAAGKDLIYLDGARDIYINGYRVEAAAAVDSIRCAAAVANVSVRDSIYDGANIASMYWWGSNITVHNSNHEQNFLAGMSGRNLMSLVSGKIYVTNAVGVEYQNCPLVNVTGTEIALALNTAAPSVATGQYFKTNANAPTTITNFLGGYLGKRIAVMCDDTNTTFDFTGNALMYGPTEANLACNANDAIICEYFDSAWHCDTYDDTP